MEPSSTVEPIGLLAEKWSLQLDEIWKAREQSRAKRSAFREICVKGIFFTADASVVVFGSLARDEYTPGSDADWALLIDGEANSDHSMVAKNIANSIECIFKKPNPTGAFGGMTFSHQLIHNIGGLEDTNANTTQRILMLLESQSIHGVGDPAYGRVVRGILNRYVEQEASHLNRERTRYKVPRFLLNDVVRFWRTMTVDFASKQRERGGVGWGIRNAKLRLSRRLIYTSGLLICFSCALNTELNAKIDPGQNNALQLVNHLRKAIKNTPLNVLAEFLLMYDHQGEASRLLFPAYDEFLRILNDDEKRSQLQALRAEDSESDPLFKEIRQISDVFQDGLNKLFFENENVFPLTKKYGVF